MLGGTCSASGDLWQMLQELSRVYTFRYLGTGGLGWLSEGRGRGGDFCKRAFVKPVFSLDKHNTKKTKKWLWFGLMFLWHENVNKSAVWPH